MDAKVCSEVLNSVREKSFVCSQKLDNDITIIKAEFRIMSNFLEGEQFDRYKSNAMELCEQINKTIDVLNRMSEFVTNLDAEVVKYDGIRYEG